MKKSVVKVLLMSMINNSIKSMTTRGHRDNYIFKFSIFKIDYII